MREELARYRERLGVTTLIVRVQWPRDAAGGRAAHIRLVGEQILPALGSS